MNEKVTKLEIVREKSAGYFVKDGIVWKVLWVADRPKMESVHDLRLSQDRRYFYFVDDVGDVSRVPRGKGDLAEVEALSEGIARCVTNRFLGECCRNRNLKPHGKNRELAGRLLNSTPGAKGLREIFQQLKMEDLRERLPEIGVSAKGRKEEIVEALVEAVLSGQAGAAAAAWDVATEDECHERHLQYENEGDSEERKPENEGNGEHYELSWPEEQQIELRISEAEKYPREELHGTGHATLLAIDPEAARRIGGTTRLADALGTLFDDADLCGLALTSFRFCLAFARLSGLFRLVESKRIDPKNLRFMFLPPDGCDLDSAFWLQRKMRQRKLTVREFPCIGGRRMHVKLLLARFRDGTKVAIVGSSNATRAGIASNEEFNVAFTCGGSRLGEPQRWFENAWQAGAPFDPHHFNFDLPPPPVRRPLFLFQCRAAKMLKERLGPLLNGVPKPGNRKSLGGYGGGLLVMPTGAGKTLTAMRWLVEDVLPDARGRRVLWLTHRRELLDQAADTANRELAVAKYPGLEMNYLGGTELGVEVDDLRHGDLVFMTVGRAHALVGRSGGKGLPKFDLVVIDEAHRASTSGVQYREVLTAIPHSARLGLTATPYRGQADDYPNFAEVFRKLEDQDEKATFLAQHTVEEIEQEPLPGGAKLFAKLDPVQIKTEFKLRISAKNEVEFAQKLRLFDAEPRNKIIVDSWFKQARGLGPSIIFCVSHEHANTVAAMINDRKGRAQAFHQCEITPEATTFAPLAGLVMNSNERGLILERFGEGEIEVLCCVQLLTEGFDLPGIGAILLARPTMSTLLLMQMIGRGRRGPAVGGLPEVKIVDFADQVEIHTDRHDAEHRHVARFEDAERAWRSRTVSGEDAREGE